MGVIDPYVPERGNEGYDVTGYDLELRYAITSNHLEGVARIGVRGSAPSLALDLVDLRVSKVAVDGRAVRWRQRSGKLHVSASLDGDSTVEVRYAGNPGPTRSTWGPVGWEELSDGVLVAAQPSGACTWFPCNDLAAQKAPVRMEVTAASSYRVVGVGALRDRQVRGSRTTWTYEQPEPTSPYLVTLHVGRYEDGGDLVCAPEHRGAVEAAFARQAEMLAVFTDCFGPYPFASPYRVVVCPEPLEIPLEAQGQAIFGTNHLDREHERLIAHELAHQWFGNSLTAAMWRDIWLHEGFACYAEWLWSERSGGPSADDHARSHHERLAGLPQDLVLADPGPDDMFDDRVYKRGALTLHALRGQLGDDAFFALLRSWVADNRHGIVTTEAFEAAAGNGALFDAWLRSPALPSLRG